MPKIEVAGLPVVKDARGNQLPGLARKDGLKIG